MSRYDEVKEEFEKEGWSLLSTDYKNMELNLLCKCPKGHQIEISLKDFRKKHQCPICNRPQSDLQNTIPKKQEGINRTLAFDQATENTGWSLFDGTTLISYGNFHVPKTYPLAKRLATIFHWATAFIEQCDPDFVAIEDIQLQGYTKQNGEEGTAVITYKTLAKVQGLFETMLFDYFNTTDNFKIVSPNTWKSYCDIQGKVRREQKKSAQENIKKWYNKEVTEDEADAICIGKYSSEIQRRGKIVYF